MRHTLPISSRFLCFCGFPHISSDWCVVWSWFFVLHVALYLEITLHTHIMVSWCLENFLQHFEVQKVGQKQHFLSKMRRNPFTIVKGFRRILDKKCCFWPTFWTSKCCRKFSRHHETMMWVCKVISRYRATCRTKNHDHTTHQSEDMCGKPQKHKNRDDMGRVCRTGL